MSKKGAAIGLGITIVVIIIVALYTNIFELARPTVEKSINYTKEVVSKVQGKDVVTGSEKVSSAIQNQTSQIKIKNPPSLP